MKNKFAFTLAEVLITLVIIGVVAALTIPTAINKYKDEELKSQFKKSYSTITQAINKTEMYDFYGRANCYYNSRNNGAPTFGECKAFYDKLFKNLSVQKICTGNAKDEGCVPTYQGYATNSGCDGFNESNINNHGYSAVLSDGTILIVHSKGATLYYFPVFLVDINGHKGPNAYGKDLFSFQLSLSPTTSNIYLSQSYGCEFPVSGGRTTTQMIQYAITGKK